MGPAAHDCLEHFGHTVLVVDLHGQVGEGVLEPAAPSPPACEKLDVCGASKFLCVATSSSASKLNQTHAEIKAALEQALKDADALTTADGWNFAPLAPLVHCK
jgi:orotidine-5'-phosphate decarboxylase